MDDVTALHIMAERLAARFGGFGPTGAADRPPLELLPAVVPDDWPAGIPLPPGATVIGAIRQVGPMTVAPGAARRTHLLFDVPLGVGQVRAFYLDALSRAGWSPLDQMLRRGGFIHRGGAEHFEADTAAREGGTHLTLEVQPAHDGTARVLMVAIVFPPGSPGPRARLSLHRPPDPYAGLPAIHLPPDVAFIAGGGRGGRSGSRVESEVTVHMDMDHADLTAFVTGQLERAGWSGRDAGLDGALAWSTWSFADGTGESYVGTLYVLRCPERPGQYRLSLVAEWAGRGVV